METVLLFTVTSQYAAQLLIGSIIQENLHNVIETLWTLCITTAKDIYRHSLHAIMLISQQFLTFFSPFNCYCCTKRNQKGLWSGSCKPFKISEQL